MSYIVKIKKKTVFEGIRGKQVMAEKRNRSKLMCRLLFGKRLRLLSLT